VSAIVSGVSCGKKNPELTGKLPVHLVTGSLAMNGEPMVDAMLQFHPLTKLPADASKIQPHANVDSEGNFHLTTYAAHDGAPAGRYAVTVSWKGPLTGVNGEQEDTMPERVPRMFRTPRTSTLVVEINEGDNALPRWDLAEIQRQAAKAISSASR
jgi:hypothetical protein